MKNKITPCQIKGCKERANCYIWDDIKKKNMFVCKKHFKEIKEGKSSKNPSWLDNYLKSKEKSKIKGSNIKN